MGFMLQVLLIGHILP